MVKLCVLVVELRCLLVPGSLQVSKVKSFTNLSQTYRLAEWFIVLHYAAKDIKTNLLTQLKQLFFRNVNKSAVNRNNIPAAAGSAAAGLTNGTNGVSSSDEDMETA